MGRRVVLRCQCLRGFPYFSNRREFSFLCILFVLSVRTAANLWQSNAVNCVGRDTQEISWAFDSRKTLPCCAWDAPEYEKNDPLACGTGTMPKYEIQYANSTLRGYNGFSNKGKLIHIGGHGCACRDQTNNYGNLTLVAVSQSCKLSWNANDFCELIKPRGILLIGDSTMEQTATVLMNHVLSSYVGTSNALHTCLKMIVFGLSDRLVYPSRQTGKGGGVERGAPFSSYVSFFLPSIVLLNTGPHIPNATEFSRIVQIVKEVTKKPQFIDISFIWKTQYAAGCKNESKYNWHLFDLFDDIVWRIWDDTNVLNVNYFSQVRHTHVCNRGTYNDGMHYCAPGPLDSIPSLLFSHLKHRQTLMRLL